MKATTPKPYLLEGKLTFTATKASEEELRAARVRDPKATAGVSIDVTYDGWRANAAGIGFVCGTLIRSFLDGIQGQVRREEIEEATQHCLGEIQHALSYSLERSVVLFKGKAQ